VQILYASLESSVLSELTYVASDSAAGSSTLVVQNAQGFSENDYIVIGRVGSETTELRQIGGITENTLTLSSTMGFAHKKDLQVQRILFNRRKFYRCDDYDTITKTGTFSLIATEDIEVNRTEGTFYEDDSILATSSSWYKATYFNLTTDKETSTDDAIAVQAAESNHYSSIDSIRKQAGFEEAYGISNEVIGDYRDEAENEFDSIVASVYSTPLTKKPKIGRQIVNLLAAGNLLIKEYGVEADIEVSKSGARMLERAKELLDKIVDGLLKLIDEDGNLIGVRNTQNVTGSNVFGVDDDKGEMFNLNSEHFKMKDPDSPQS